MYTHRFLGHDACAGLSGKISVLYISCTQGMSSRLFIRLRKKSTKCTWCLWMKILNFLYNWASKRDGGRHNRSLTRTCRRTLRATVYGLRRWNYGDDKEL